MLRFFSNRVRHKLHFNQNGELGVLTCPGYIGRIRVCSLGLAAYLYVVYRTDAESKLGQYKQYSLTATALLGGLLLRRCSKLLYRLTLLEGGKFVKVQKYPWFGFGHMKNHIVDIADVAGVYKCRADQWYNLPRWGKGFYKLKYDRAILGQRVTDTAYFRPNKDLNKDVFRLIALGRPINEKNLRSLSKLNK